MYPVSSDALQFFCAFVPRFSAIIPIISDNATTLLSERQMKFLFDAGCSVTYLMLRQGRKFTYSKRGCALQALYEQQSSENFMRNLNTLIERTLFSHSPITICENSSLEQH